MWGRLKIPFTLDIMTIDQEDLQTTCIAIEKSTGSITLKQNVGLFDCYPIFYGTRWYELGAMDYWTPT